MVRFRKTTVQAISDQIVRLGLDNCPVCSSTESMAVSRRPVILSVGGLAWEDPATRDRDANISFAVRIRCGLCGYIMLFDAEKFHSGEEPTMTLLSYDEEDELEGDS
jgi:ribosomal protein S27AE